MRRKVWYAPYKFESYGEAEIKAVEESLRDGWLAGFGPKSVEFEQKIAKEFQESAISDFIGFSIKGERYPLMHAISELRYRVFAEKLGINKKVETRACSLNRAYGVAVPNYQKKFCQDYDALVELAKTSLIQTVLFEKIYLNAEPFLLKWITPFNFSLFFIILFIWRFIVPINFSSTLFYY